MSHYMTALAMKQTGLKPAAKIVLYWLADHHNETTGACFPSLNTLAKECEMNRTTVVRHLDDLERNGLIQRTHRVRENGSQTSTEYYLNLSPVAKHNSPCCKTQQPPVAKCDPHNLGNNNLGNEQIEDTNVSLQVAQNQNHNNTIGDFDEFWSQCPRKIGKDAALRAWKSALKRSDAKTIIDGMKRHAKEVQGREKQYIPHPSTWLNAGRWQDESQDAPTTSKQKATDHERMTNIATLIRKRISSAVTAVDAREAIAAGYVTKEECRGLGLV